MNNDNPIEQLSFTVLVHRYADAYTATIDEIPGCNIQEESLPEVFKSIGEVMIMLELARISTEPTAQFYQLLKEIRELANIPANKTENKKEVSQAVDVILEYMHDFGRRQKEIK